jgi:hypothetical protein
MLSPSPFQYVQEWDNAFLSLFPHRYDYIYAAHPDPGQTPEWRTESRHPLSDRLLEQGSHLFGVRFGAQTQYGLLDIDSTSTYHPKQDPLALSRLLAALEPLGLTTPVVCTSSYTGGLHLYFPFEQAQNSWELATGLATVLENAGFKLKAGQLEVFPNPKPYVVQGTLSLFNAHRLPLQAGSYLLNAELQPVWSDQRRFVQQWQFAQSRNDLQTATLKQLIKQAKRKQYQVSGKADKFINDLNAEIERGWTGSGQTNRLLGRITMRCYIFHHVLMGGDPLSGQALADQIVETARSLPGYDEWCRHQHEIEKRAADWARCIESSRYFPYGQDASSQTPSGSKGQPSESTAPTSLSWNQQQSEAARERIRQAIADLLDKNSLPPTATARFQALVQYGIGGSTLYRHRDLWHPACLWKTPPDLPNSNNSPLASEDATANGQIPSSLLAKTDRNLSSNTASSDLFTSLEANTGRNINQDNAFHSDGSQNGHSNEQQSSSTHNGNTPTEAGFVQQALFDVKAWLEAVQEAAREVREESDRAKQSAQHTNHIARMQQYLNSGDPILMAEALAWAEIYPDVLEIPTHDD